MQSGIKLVRRRQETAVGELDRVAICTDQPGLPYSFASYNGAVYAGGQILCAWPSWNSFQVSYIAAYFAQTWHSLGSGLDAPAWALAVWNGSLYAGGSFVLAGGKPSLHMARWTDSTFTDARLPPAPDDAVPWANVRLYSPQPCPSHGGIRVAYYLPVTERVRISLLDAAGRTVSVLADGPASSGRHAQTNDLRSGTRRLSTGVYTLLLEAGGEKVRQRLLLLR